MNIKLSGLTPPNKIPITVKNMPHGEFDNKEVLKLSEEPFKISKIMGLDIKANILKCNIKKEHGKCILNINGNKEITVSYRSDESFNNLHELKYNTPFTTCIEYKFKHVKFKNIYVAIESADIDLIDERTVKLDTKLFVAPLVLKK